MKTRSVLRVCSGFLLAIFPPATAFSGNFYQGVSPANVFWPGGVVPYQFGTNITAGEQQTYLDGVREWELAANIHFVPRTTQTNWILFQYSPGTFVDQFVPYTVPESMTVSVLSRAQVCHEMGHALGFTHENIRVDKNTYITVLTNNIYPASNIYWFTIDPASVANGGYDYESVMHLANNFSSVDPADPTVYTQVANPPYQRFQPFMGNLALSVGDRAAAAYLYGPPTVPLTNVVTTTADVGTGSLRAALYYGMDHPGTTIRFNIPTNDLGFSHGVFTIYLTGFLPPLVANGTVIDGSTQPGFNARPLIVIDGSQVIPEAYAAGTVTGLYIFAADCQLKNLSFQNFNWNGITLSYPGASNNTIAGCWCGPDPTGTNAAPNAYQGILIYNGASYNMVGGTNALARNVLSGNSQYGVFITGTHTTGNNVCGNYIGTDASGAMALSNAVGGMIVTGGANSNVVGGAQGGEGNVLSGNFNFGLWVDSDNNTVQGNLIGLNANGTMALPNSFIGMYLIGGAQSNLVTGNVLSGNLSEGIRLTGPGTSANLVQGNYIGTDLTGTLPIPNGFAGLTFFDGASSNLAGGTTLAVANIVSGNGGYGVVFGDPGTMGNLVEGNFIGLAANGVAALANAWSGLIIDNGAEDNVVGLNLAGLGAGNRIACNGNEGVAVYDNPTVGNVIRGNSVFSNNYIGINLVGGTENSSGVTANHIGGAVSGPNDLQNYPVISSAVASGADTVISGALNSTAGRTFLIDVYRNLAPDPSGYGQGQVYAGSTTVGTDNHGNGVFLLITNGAFAGQYFSATATDQTTGDTSEFSLDVVASNGLVPSMFAGPFSLTSDGFGASLLVASGQSYHVQSATNLAAVPIIWINLTNFVAGGTNVPFVDHSATDSRARFYRVISP